MSHKYVYLFSEGNGKMRELLGGKGANLYKWEIRFVELIKKKPLMIIKEN